MSAWWLAVGLAGYLIAFLLDEGYEYKPKTRKNEVLHKIYAIIGVISFTMFILALFF
jgi:hypothetical protein